MSAVRDAPRHAADRPADGRDRARLAGPNIGQGIGQSIGRSIGRAIMLGVAVGAILCGRVMAQTMTIDYKDGEIHLQATEQSLETVLTAMADAAGFTLVLDGALDDPISQSFVMPLADAIREVTRNHISIAQYETGADGARYLSELRVYAKANAAPAPNPTRGRDRSPTGGNRSALNNRVLAMEQRNQIAQLRDTLINSSDAGQRREAVDQLGQIASTAAVHALSQALRDPDADVKQQAIGVLGQIGSGQATRSLGRALRQEQDAETRLQVINTLVGIGSPAARNYIESALRDADENVRRAAEQALQEF